MTGRVLRERVISALVFAPIVAGAFYAGGAGFALLILAISTLGAAEYRGLLAQAGIDIDIWFVPVCAAVALSACLSPKSFVVSLLAGALVLMSLSLRKGSAPVAMYSVSGEVYIAGLLGSLSLLRNGPDGKAWALFVLFVTWATDVMAYAGGSVLGRHKLAPGISPGKSWEGAAAGLVGSVLAGTIAGTLLKMPWFVSTVGALGLGVLAEMGDLVESSLKRYCKAKDSGKFMPGHGGCLDRFDSLLFSGAGGLLLRMIVKIMSH